MTQIDEIRQVQEATRTVRQNVSRVMIGKEEVIDLLMVAMLCEGHVLFEDVPGIGKTTLAKTLAKSLGCTFQRIQFTSDLLPSDVIGLSVFNQKSGDFEWKSGPIFSNIVLFGVFWCRYLGGGRILLVSDCRYCSTSLLHVGVGKRRGLGWF